MYKSKQSSFSVIVIKTQTYLLSAFAFILDVWETCPGTAWLGDRDSVQLWPEHTAVNLESQSWTLCIIFIVRIIFLRHNFC